MTAPVKNIFMTREFSLNKSASKHLWLAILIENKKARPFMALTGDKNVIKISPENWTALKTMKGEIMNYFLKKQNAFKMSLSGEKEDTFFSGKSGNALMLHVCQVERETEMDQYLYFGRVTIEKLFALEGMIDHFMQTINEAIPEIEQFLRDLAEGEDCESLKSKTENGVDLKMLQAELTEYPIC